MKNGEGRIIYPSPRALGSEALNVYSILHSSFFIVFQS
jgi:hypothetical protein